MWWPEIYMWRPEIYMWRLEYICGGQKHICGSWMLEQRYSRKLSTRVEIYPEMSYNKIYSGSEKIFCC